MRVGKMKEVFGQISDPESSKGWNTPTGKDESLEEFGDIMFRMLGGEESVERDRDYWVMDLCCGGGILTDHLYDRSQEEGLDVNFVGADLEPTHAQERFWEKDDVRVLGGDANSILEVNQREYDMIYAINAFQQFPEIQPLAENISDSVKDDGFICFTSTDSIKDVFRMLEDYSDESFVKKHPDTGREFLEVNQVDVGDIETSFTQYPRPLDDYIEIFSDLGYDEVRRGEVAATTEPVLPIAESIIGCRVPPASEVSSTSYDYAVVSGRS